MIRSSVYDLTLSPRRAAVDPTSLSKVSRTRTLLLYSSICTLVQGQPERIMTVGGGIDGMRDVMSQVVCAQY